MAALVCTLREILDLMCDTEMLIGSMTLSSAGSTLTLGGNLHLFIFDRLERVK